MKLCRFKETKGNIPNSWCFVIQGECQFMCGGYEDGTKCPILDNYPYESYVPYWLSSNMDKDGNVHVESVKVEDLTHGNLSTDLSIYLTTDPLEEK